MDSGRDNFVVFYWQAVDLRNALWVIPKLSFELKNSILNYMQDGLFENMMALDAEISEEASGFHET